MRYEYDVFGAIRSEVGTSDNPRKFTGKEYESDVRLYYFAARYYDPYIGRFNQRDPAGDGLNWYVYVGNNPLAFIDPSGLRALSQLEASALNSVFGGSINPSDLDVQIIEGLHVDLPGGKEKEISGGQPIGTNKIQIHAALFKAAGLNANSTVADTDVLNPAVINYLSTFIHEAAHYWQQTNSLYSRNRYSPADRSVALYAFSFDQLLTLDLGKEQHASAVGAFFVLSWQLNHGASEIRLDFSAVGRFRFNGVDGFGNPFAHSSVRDGWGDTVNRTVGGSLLWFFNPLTNQLRNPVPGPLQPTTWGGIK